MNVEEMKKDLDAYDKELTFELKYCARLASYHQNSKDTVKALKIKLKELAEKLKIEEERLKKLAELKEKDEAKL